MIFGRSSQESFYSSTISVFFLPDEWTKHISTLAFLAAVVVADFYNMRKGTLASPHNRIDYWSHLVGYSTGIAGGVLINKRLGPKQGKLALNHKKTEVIQPVR